MFHKWEIMLQFERETEVLWGLVFFGAQSKSHSKRTIPRHVPTYSARSHILRTLSTHWFWWRHFTFAMMSACNTHFVTLLSISYTNVVSRVAPLPLGLDCIICVSITAWCPGCRGCLFLSLLFVQVGWKHAVCQLTECKLKYLIFFFLIHYVLFLQNIQ